MKILETVGANYFGAWKHTRTACRAIIPKDGQLLLTYETATGQWMIPGGGLEPGEDARACCIREAAEETGLFVEPGACFLEIDEYYEDWKYISLYYVCRPVGTAERHLTPREQEVGTEPRWLPFDDILNIFSQHARYADTDEMRRGIYLREYMALCEYERKLKKKGR